MSVDYNSFAKTFSESRKNMKWEEISYFLDFVINSWIKNISVLDVGCWNGRLLGAFNDRKLIVDKYVWVDLSEKLLKEAENIYPEDEFLNIDMIDLNKIKKKFSCIFFIASFHHLKSVDDRLNVLKNVRKLLKDEWHIFMTNWALNSYLNREKYKKSVIGNSENEFWSIDYNIKIWKFDRFYHSFSLKELEYLFWDSWFNIIENRLFDNNKNYISIVS